MFDRTHRVLVWSISFSARVSIVSEFRTKTSYMSNYGQRYLRKMRMIHLKDTVINGFFACHNQNSVKIDGLLFFCKTNSISHSRKYIY